jgi:hypothetical protein
MLPGQADRNSCDPRRVRHREYQAAVKRNDVETERILHPKLLGVGLTSRCFPAEDHLGEASANLLHPCARISAHDSGPL